MFLLTSILFLCTQTVFTLCVIYCSLLLGIHTAMNSWHKIYVLGVIDFGSLHLIIICLIVC
jgi:hypothetical protein